MYMNYFECLSVTVSAIYRLNLKLRLYFVQNWVLLYINENCCAQLSQSSHYRFAFLCLSLQNKEIVKSIHQTLPREKIRRFQGFFMVS